MNKTTISLNEQQYREIITTIKSGFTYQGKKYKPSECVAFALQLEYNVGLRISDILRLKLENIVFFDGSYHINIVEKKTGKKRFFTINNNIYQFIKEYSVKNNITATEVLIKITDRQVQRVLKTVCDYLKITGIGTHSFRKSCACNIYEKSGHDIELTRMFLNHSSVTTTQRYISQNSKKLQNILENYNNII